MKEELIEEFQNGNKRAGDDFYNANKGLIYSAFKKYRLKSMDDEETLALVNQAFAKTMKIYDSSKGEFSTYFMTSAKGHILRHYRDYEHTIRVKRLDFEKSKITVFCDSLDRVIYTGETTEICLKDSFKVEDDCTQIFADEALSKITKISREAFSLQYVNGLSQMEIAKILGTSQVGVSRRITKAKKQLKAILKEVS